MSSFTSLFFPSSQTQELGLIMCSTFVNGRNRATIMQEMRERIARQDQDQEVAQVIEVSYLSTEYTALYYTMT